MLMHPAMMGLAFKYLLMSKDVPTTVKPSGFKYACDPEKALGLKRLTSTHNNASSHVIEMDLVLVHAPFQSV
jgi:hypothetical protein